MTTFEIETDKKEKLSIAKLTEHVIEQLNWNFISFPEKNIAIDGLFEIFNSNNHKTGHHIWVEVKTGDSYYKNGNDNTYIIVDLKNKEKVDKWKKIWNKVPGAIVLVFVSYIEKDTKQPIFYWVDLKNPDSYVDKNGAQIKIPSSQIIEKNFFSKCKTLIDFNGNSNYAGKLPTISMGANSFDYIKLTNSLKSDARKQYLKWSKKTEIERTNPKFGEIIVNRVGWQHISRKTRQKPRIIQSWQLLTVAEEMIKKVSFSRLIGAKPKWKYNPNTNRVTFKNYYYLKAKIKFNYRRETIVYVVLRKITEQNCADLEIINSKTWFYSVYEGERGVKKVGNQISI